MPIWISTKVNPADIPSRMYTQKGRLLAHRTSQPFRVLGGAVACDKAWEEIFVRHSAALSMLNINDQLYYVLQHRLFVVMHVFTGSRRPGDLHEQVHNLAEEYRLLIFAVSIDVALGDDHDICRDKLWNSIHDLIQAGFVVGCVCGPPCNTWSIARHRVGTGPPPLRSAQHPYGLPWVLENHQQRLICEKGTVLFRKAIEICQWVAASGGVYLLEHPKDYGKPFCTIFRRS